MSKDKQYHPELKRIREVRKKMKPKASQQQIADKVKCSRAYISYMEKGEANPTIDVLKKVAKAMNTNLKNILGAS